MLDSLISRQDPLTVDFLAILRVGCVLTAWAGLLPAQEQKDLPAKSDGLARLPFAGSGLPESDRGSVPVRIAALPESVTGTTTSGIPQSLAVPRVLAWLTELIRENLPPTYDDDREWGGQKEVWAGVKLRREGLRIETKRRKKTVNSGTWTRYSIKIVDPEKNLNIQFHRLEMLPDGRIAFSLSVDCTLDVFGRVSQWARDVQLFSLSANADAACRLNLEGTVRLQLNPLTLPPDLIIRPHVDVARIDLTYYRVRRISQIGGDWAKYLGEGLRRTVDDRLRDMNAKLVAKINAQLEKQEKKLKVSAQEWLHEQVPWGTEKSPDASGGEQVADETSG